MTLEEILTLPARMAAMERDIIALGARPYWQPLPAPPPPVGLWTPELTEVERELLPMIAAGWSNQEIAERLKLSVSSVKACLRELYEEHNVRDRVGLLLATS